MVYEATIQFTLDTICPWTYLARRRLQKALAQLPSDNAVQFSIVYKPYQLYPDTSLEGEDKYDWYRRSRYGDSEEKMHMYTTLMSAYGVAEGIDFHFHGQIANTLPAHRLIQYFQDRNGPEVADAIVASLYRQYFEEEKHPSSLETLTQAAVDAGLDESAVKAVVEDETVWLADTKILMQEQKGNGVDAVPHIIIEGKKRDITIEGCREVTDYIKSLITISRDSI